MSANRGSFATSTDQVNSMDTILVGDLAMAGAEAVKPISSKLLLTSLGPSHAPVWRVDVMLETLSARALVKLSQFWMLLTQVIAIASSRVQGAELKCRRQAVTDAPKSCPANQARLCLVVYLRTLTG